MTAGPRPLTPAAARHIDRIAIEQIGIPELVLMENAGLRCAEWIRHRLRPGNAVVLCGTGNNGGDGLVIARQLAVTGLPVAVLLAGEPARMTEPCRINWQIANSLRLPNLQIRTIDRHHDDWSGFRPGPDGVIVDALLGISASGPPREPMAALIEWANQVKAVRVAIDLPTGVDPWTGATPGAAFHADWTLMIERRKSIAELPEAAPFPGRVEVIPLGLPPWVAEEACRLADG